MDGACRDAARSLQGPARKDPALHGIPSLRADWPEMKGTAMDWTWHLDELVPTLLLAGTILGALNG
jgi:hypothetical protein